MQKCIGRKKADEKVWDTVISPLDVYRFCGQAMNKDPRLTPEYKGAWEEMKIDNPDNVEKSVHKFAKYGEQDETVEPDEWNMEQEYGWESHTNKRTLGKNAAFWNV